MWENIAGQLNVKEKLKAVLRSGKTSHAYLFHGPEGTGKDAVAIEFAKALNCLHYGENGACDNCTNCLKASSLRTELLYFVCALPAGTSDDSKSDPLEKLSSSDFNSYLEELDRKAENPYHKISLEGANFIRINSIRNLIDKIYLSASPELYKVFLISEADKMRAEAANALLKILEEPPRKSVIILTTSKPDSIAPTISGRCQKIFFDRLSDDDIKQKLIKSTDYKESEIVIASRISLGSYSRAERLLNEGISQSRETVIKFLIACLRDDYAELTSVCRDISSKNNREKAKQFLYLMNIWFRDLMHLKSGNDYAVINHDLIARLEKLNQNYPAADVFRIILELEETEKLISGNVHLNLILVNLGLKLKKYITR